MVRLGLLIATSKPGAENKAALELGDALFRRDPSVETWVTRFPGTVVVATGIESLDAYIILVGTPLSTPLRLVPLLDPDKLSQVLRATPTLAGEGRVHVRCELRGRKGECRQVEATLLRELGLTPVSRSRAPLVLHIEGVDDLWGASLLPRGCDSTETIYGEPGARRQCVSFAKKVLISLRRII